MITYILETLAFQLVFLLTYDLFLKKETFFQWNRVYLLATYVLSLVLPWVKFEMLKTTMPKELGNVTVFLTQLDEVVLTPEGVEPPFWSSFPWYYGVLGFGSVLSIIWFAHKLLQIRKLKRLGTIQQYPDYDKITVQHSTLAFSFFRNIFLGAEIQKEKEANIIAHELVHVKQRHTLDLLFFELARIVFWFNPLTYVYQNRMAELHEFIADAQVVKDNKREHFEMLLSEAFKTQHISFINQFFNKSLIKKRIVMLQKKRSKAVWQLKYVLLLPLVLGMLMYTSCEGEKIGIENSETVSSEEIVPFEFEWYTDGINRINTLSKEHNLLVSERNKLIESNTDKELKLVKELNVKIDNLQGEINKAFEVIASNIQNLSDKEKKSFREFEKKLNGRTDEINADTFPFATIDKVPVFPGCENAADKKECFMENLENHIKKNFHYPEAAQEKGIQGRVATIFVIDIDGSITDIRTRGPHPILEEEAKRILEKLPKMLPGKQKGQVMKVPYSIPITFRLQNQPDGTTVNGSKDYLLVSGKRVKKDGKTIFEGTVMDKESMPLSGVIVSIEGKDAGVMSNFNGIFSLAVDEADVVKFQYSGLPNKVVKVSDY